MTTLFWIIGSSVLMGVISLIGGLTFFVGETIFKKLLLPLVALSAGSLIGGALFHMLPEAIEHIGNEKMVYVWLVIGFVSFLILEQFLHWHHCHNLKEHKKEPLTYLILIADGLHNFIGGLAVGASFIVDIRLGIATWIAAAAHEIPQELGDFGVLVHGGWKGSTALLYNFLSSLTFLLGGILVYTIAKDMETIMLVPFAAGNFIYIAAADLIPQIKHGTNLKDNFTHLVWFIIGLMVLLIPSLLLAH